jgi:hypothetical protein
MGLRLIDSACPIATTGRLGGPFIDSDVGTGRFRGSSPVCVALLIQSPVVGTVPVGRGKETSFGSNRRIT